MWKGLNQEIKFYFLPLDSNCKTQKRKVNKKLKNKQKNKTKKHHVLENCIALTRNQTCNLKRNKEVYLLAITSVCGDTIAVEWILINKNYRITSAESEIRKHEH